MTTRKEALNIILDTLIIYHIKDGSSRSMNWAKDHAEIILCDLESEGVIKTWEPEDE